jgi:D-serine deaminase-like pyridoxal phosphate-dependent protein
MARTGRAAKMRPGRVLRGRVSAASLAATADAALGPGDVVGLGISHPCTTLDKWRVLVVLDDDDLVIDIVHAFF